MGRLIKANGISQVTKTGREVRIYGRISSGHEIIIVYSQDNLNPTIQFNLSNSVPASYFSELKTYYIESLDLAESILEQYPDFDAVVRLNEEFNG